MNKILTSLLALWGVVSVNGQIELGIKNACFMQVVVDSLKAKSLGYSSKNAEKKQICEKKRVIVETKKIFYSNSFKILKSSSDALSAFDKYEDNKEVKAKISHKKTNANIAYGMGIRAPNAYEANALLA